MANPRSEDKKHSRFNHWYRTPIKDSIDNNMSSISTDKLKAGHSDKRQT